MAREQNENRMAQLNCRECGKVVNHPVGTDGGKTLCRRHMLSHFDDVGLL